MIILITNERILEGGDNRQRIWSKVNTLWFLFIPLVTYKKYGSTEQEVI